MLLPQTWNTIFDRSGIGIRLHFGSRAPLREAALPRKGQRF